MAIKQFVAAVALVGAAAQAVAVEPWDPRQSVPTVMYYVTIPLDAAVRKEREASLGMMLHGKREYQAVVLDTRMLNFIDGGIGAKFLIAGAVALGGIAAVAGGGKGAEQQQQAQQNQQVAAKAAATASTAGGSSSGGSSGGSTGGSGTPAPCPQVCPPK
jgi:hypothetical protein